MGLEWQPKDLSARYDRTYLDVLIEKENKEKEYEGIVYVQSGNYDPSGNKVWITVPEKDEDGSRKEKIIPYTRFFVKEDRPENCISNTDTSSFIYSWNPERQWKRGVCVENTFLWFGTKMQKTRWDWNVAKSIFYPIHCASLKDALEQLADKGITSRAINNEYWVGKSDGTSQLFRRRVLLGSFLGKKFYPNGAAQIFHEELKTELPTLKEMYA